MLPLTILSSGGRRDAFPLDVKRRAFGEFAQIVQERCEGDARRLVQ
jgi:hypothetical protein